MWSLAVFRATPKDSQCHGPLNSIILPHPDVFIGQDSGDPLYLEFPTDPPPPEYASSFTHDELLTHIYNARCSAEYLMDGSAYQILGAVLLSTTRGSWYDNQRRDYLKVSREMLTPAGMRLLEAMEEAFGRTAIIATFLDT